MDRRAMGNVAETTALEYLAARGLVLVCRNFLCKAGELDLVMFDGPVLAIIEVRSRRDRGFGTAADSIGWKKRRRVVRAANYLLLRNPGLRRLPARFDVVTLDNAAADGGIEWIRGAFDASG